MDETNKIIVLTTTGSEDLALRLARELVGNREAACVNIVPGVRSLYRWRGEVCDDREWILLIKTSADLFAKVERTIARVSDYECPEVIALSITAGSRKYLEWLDACLDRDETDISG